MSSQSDPSHSTSALSSTRKILLINGPNLNLLGTREPQIYGSTTLSDLTTELIQHGSDLNLGVVAFQSNHEGAIVDFLHSHFTPSLPSSSELSTKAPSKIAAIINPAAYTHTSVAIRDAFLATSIPFVEVHISNVHAREEFRHHSFLSDKATGVVVGLGVYGYHAALEFWARKWDAESKDENQK